MSLWSTLRNLPNRFLARLQPGSPGKDFLLEEKVLATLRVYGNRVRFLPSVDQIVEETTDMRIAYRQMLREPCVKAPLLQKVLQVAKNEVQVHPASEKPIDEMAAEFVRHCLQRSKGNTRRMALSILFGGLMDGYSVCEKTWAVEDRGEWAGKIILKQLKAKDTRYAHLEGDQYRNVLYVRDTRNNMRYTASNFIVWQHLPIFENPTGWSDFRSAYRAFWLMDTAQKLRAIGMERFTLPVIKGTYDDPEQRPTLEAAIENLRSLGWISLPAGAQIEAMELATRAQPEFTEAIQDLRQEMFLAISGAVLQSLQGTTSDGRGNSDTHQDNADLLPWFLGAELGDALSDQMVPDLIDMNFVEAGYPRITFGATSDSGLADSLKIDQGLQQMGLPLSRKEMYDKYKRQKPIDDADALSPPQSQQPGATAYSLPQPGQFADATRQTIIPGPQAWVGFNGGPGSDQPAYFGNPAVGLLPDRSLPNPVWQSNQNSTGFDSSPSPPDKIAARNLNTFCGGPGGTPGPCPEGSHDQGAGQLDSAVQQLHATPEGRQAIEKGTSIAGRVFSKLRAGVESALKAADTETNGGVSLITHGIKGGDVGALAAGAGSLFSAVFQSVHQEVYENALAQHSLPGAHAIGKIASTAAAHGENAILKGTAWAMSKFISKNSEAVARFAEDATLTDGDRKLLASLADLARQQLAEIYRAAGADAPLPDESKLEQSILAALRGQTGAQGQDSIQAAQNGSLSGTPAAGDVPRLGTPPGAASGGPPSAAAALSGHKHSDQGGPAASGAPFPVSVSKDVAPTGAHQDQQKADQLLAASVRAGVATLSDIAKTAYARLLHSANPQSTSRLFNDAETARLADTLASVAGTAALLGGARIKLRANQANESQGARKFSEDSTDLSPLGDALTPMKPVEAADYFNALVPNLGVDPQIFGESMARHAFTMATATDQTMLERVKQLIAAALESGNRSTTHLGIQDLLDQAGVTPANPQYAEMVVRTNLMDAYNHGAHQQLAEEADTFPVWRYSGIRDGRQGKDHEVHFDKYFPAKTSFAEVRGDRPYNCRCTFIPIDKWEWARLQNDGAKVERFSDRLVFDRGRYVGAIEQSPSGDQLFLRPGEPPVVITDFGDGDGSSGTPAGDDSNQIPSSALMCEDDPPLLDLPDVRQTDNYGCGAAAAMAVGRYFGVGPETFQEWEKLLGTDPQQGTPPEAIIAGLQGLGLQAQARQLMTLNDLQACWQAGQPVICCIQDYGDDAGPGDYEDGHYVVVIGLGMGGYVFVQDSSADNALDGSGSDAAPGRVIIPAGKFLQVWHDKTDDGRFFIRYGIAVGK